MRVEREGQTPIKLWTTSPRGDVPVEPKALEQLRNIARLPFVFRHVAAMPDVHLGMGATVGSVIATRGAIVPAAVGVDIGCGMEAVRTSLAASDLPDSLGPVRSAIEQAVPHGRTNQGGPGDRGAWNVPPPPVPLAWSGLVLYSERALVSPTWAIEAPQQAVYGTAIVVALAAIAIRSIRHRAIGDAPGLSQVVGYDHDGVARLEPEDQGFDLLSCRRIERRARLIHENDFRLVGQGARQTETLLLPARQPFGALAQPVFDFVPQSHLFQIMPRILHGLGAVEKAVIARAEQHVLE